MSKDPTGKYLKQHFAVLGLFYFVLAILSIISMSWFAQAYMDALTMSPLFIFVAVVSVMIRMIIED